MTAPAAGDRVGGRYRLESRIGAGGMGVVWRATDTVLDRVVALKRVVLPEDPAAAADLRSRVRREAKVAARLQHPGLVGIFDVIEADGEPWLVLEYVPARDLATVLGERGAIDPGEAAALGVTLAEALAAMHEAGVVHRDVKPANVLFGERTAKLTDFGISRGIDDLTLTATGALIGTPAFLAPEVALGHPATPASDVFGLGATLYAAVEGTPPYGDTGGNLLMVLRLAAEGRIRPPRRAGPLTGPMGRLLHPDPRQRPGASDAAALLADVVRGGGAPPPRTGPAPSRTAGPDTRIPRTFAPGVPMSGVPDTVVPGPPGRPSTDGRRRGGRVRKWWPALAVGGAIALVTVLVVALLPDRPASTPAADGTTPAACDTSRGELVVGLVAPLSGDLAALGLGMRNSADLAVRQANAACTVPGYLLRLQAEDDQAAPPVAEQAAVRLASDPAVVGVVGTLNSSTSQVVAPVLAAAGIAQISPANTNATLSRGAQYATAPARPYGSYFRLAGTDPLQGPFAAQGVTEAAGTGRAYVVVDDGKTYGSDLAGGFAAEIERLGSRVVDRLRVGEADTDFTAVVTAVQAADRAEPDGLAAVYYGGEYPAAAPLSAQLGAAGLDVVLIGGDGLVSSEYAALGGRDGDIATTVGAPPESLASAERFLADYAAGGYSEGAQTYGAATFDATNLLVAATADATGAGGWSPDRRGDVVGSVQSARPAGAVGPIAFDEFGDLVDPALTVNRLEGGEWGPNGFGP